MDEEPRVKFGRFDPQVGQRDRDVRTVFGGVVERLGQDHAQRVRGRLPTELVCNQAVVVLGLCESYQPPAAGE